eukprot:13018720-Alexandrium_andersonii.AAC.1
MAPPSPSFLPSPSSPFSLLWCSRTWHLHAAGKTLRAGVSHDGCPRACRSISFIVVTHRGCSQVHSAWSLAGKGAKLLCWGWAQ